MKPAPDRVFAIVHKSIDGLGYHASFETRKDAVDCVLSWSTPTDWRIVEYVRKVRTK